MSENKEKKATEPIKKEKSYKVTSGAFKKRNEALQKAVDAKKAGISASLEIGKKGYSILYAKCMTKSEAEETKKAIEAKKFKAEVFEQ